MDWNRKDSPHDITIVLLCSGNGSDAQTYRPNRDDSQWWGRRDALVRCVSAALFSQNYGSAEVGKKNERTYGGIKLILLFDGDGSMMCMNRVFANEKELDKSHARRTEKDIFIPSERNLISIWRDACNNNKRAKSRDNFSKSLFGGKSQRNESSSLSCRLHLYENNRQCVTSAANAANIKSLKPKPNDIKSMNSKREVLNHIQKHCTFEFLKSIKLNASNEVILKKYNRAKLIKVWMDWCKYCDSSEGINPTYSQNHNEKKIVEDNSISKDVFHFIISNETVSLAQDDATGITNRDKMKKRHHSESSTFDTENPNVIVSFLHESCASELPVSSCKKYLKKIKNKSNTSNGPFKVILFMGAVRDMTLKENKNLASVCASMNIPLVGCRLGPVPEFTSKILQILTLHIDHERLKPALLQLHQNELEKKFMVKKSKLLNRDDKDCEDKSINQKANTFMNRLHVIATLAIPSSEVTCSLSERSYMMWTIVRLTVCTLWRSKVASSMADSATAWNLENVLSFVFNDGILLTINQNTLVDMLARKHQAAPSEYQILQALCELRDNAISNLSNKLNLSSNGTVQWVEIYKRLLSSEKERLKDRKSPFLCALELSQRKRNQKESKDKADSKSTDIINMFYSKGTKICTDENSSGTVLALFHIDQLNQESSLDEKHKNALKESSTEMKHIFSKENIPFLEECIVSNQMVDFASTSVTMLQHLIYQGKLFGLIKRKCSHQVSNESEL